MGFLYFIGKPTAATMRSILYTIALVAANPTGKYCGNYMGVVDSSLTFNSDSDLTLWINVNGSEATCPNEAYTMAADGTITITNMNQPGNCIGELVKPPRVPLSKRCKTFFSFFRAGRRKSAPTVAA